MKPIREPQINQYFRWLFVLKYLPWQTSRKESLNDPKPIAITSCEVTDACMNLLFQISSKTRKSAQSLFLWGPFHVHEAWFECVDKWDLRYPHMRMLSSLKHTLRKFAAVFVADIYIINYETYTHTLKYLRSVKKCNWSRTHTRTPHTRTLPHVWKCA